jgi:hypothetical protein
MKRLASPLAGAIVALTSPPSPEVAPSAAFDRIVDEILLQDHSAPILEVSWTEKSLRSPPVTEPGDESTSDARDALA